MKKADLLFILTLACSISFYAQQSKTTVLKTSQSIYTFNSLNDKFNSYAELNKRLRFPSFEFFQIYLPDLDFNSLGAFGNFGYFGHNRRSVFEFKNMKKKPDTYKLDDLVRYQNNKLSREINYKNDPSQWNLYRKENRIQPYFLEKDKQKKPIKKD